MTYETRLILAGAVLVIAIGAAVWKVLEGRR